MCRPRTKAPYTGDLELLALVYIQQRQDNTVVGHIPSIGQRMQETAPKMGDQFHGFAQMFQFFLNQRFH